MSTGGESMSKILFQGMLPIRPKPWKRTTGSGKRYMLTTQRDYYVALFMALVDAGMKPLPPPPKEFAIRAEFYYTGKRYSDIDNFGKGLLDSGQLSKWRIKSMIGMVLFYDFWDDKQFADIHFIRHRDADENKIEVTIWRLP